MKYYTFLPRFHDAIRQGIKVSTIRQKTKVKVGERFALRFWTGRPYGSPMGILGTAVCTAVLPIHIPIGPDPRDTTGMLYPIFCVCRFVIDGKILGPDDREALAKDEGFTDAEDMGDHFHRFGKLPLSGVLTRWDPASLEIRTATDAAMPANPKADPAAAESASTPDVAGSGPARC